MLDDGNRKMRPVVYKSRDIVLGHLGKLLLEDALQPREDDEAFPGPIIVDHSKFNLPAAFLQNCGLFRLLLSAVRTLTKSEGHDAYLLGEGNDLEWLLIRGFLLYLFLLLDNR